MSNNSNPFEKGRGGFNINLPTANPDQGNTGGNRTFERARPSSENTSIQKRNAEAKHPTDVNFPNHLYIPNGAQSLDLRRVINTPTGTTGYNLFSFTSPAGAITRFIKYGIYNDGDNGANYDFLPLVNGSRIFPYHGDPSQNFKIYLGLGPDLSESSMIPCQLSLQPLQTITWLVSNTSGVDTSMGVRMVGYFDTTVQRTQGRFGG